MIAAPKEKIAKANYLNIFNKLNIIKNSTITTPKITTAISSIYLETVIFQFRKLGAEKADCYFRQLVRSIVYYYSVGIAYRDLKPKNLLLIASGELNITSFNVVEYFKEVLKGRSEMKKSSKRYKGI